jgi:head-tail adaptor
MPRRNISAADYIERHDAEVRVILGELVENAARLNLHWAAAAYHVRRDPERALKELAEAEVVLSVAVRIERIDALRRISGASDLLDGELPDDDRLPSG